MDRLERDFAGDIDFFVLDVDKADARLYLDEFAIRTRSTYLLLDSTGGEIMRWSGPLSGDQVAAEMASFLDSVE